jgi:hypothetical protein
MLAAANEKYRPIFAEPHYTLRELATHWHMSVRTLRAWFIDEPGVIRFGETKLTKQRKRAYVSLRVPESIAAAVYAKMTGAETRPTGRARRETPRPEA